MKLHTSSPEETIALGEKIGAMLSGGEVIAYCGDLGVGKTTITRGICRGMGIDDDVCSPTFALVNEYHGTGKSLYHFDMYRITSASDLETTGFYDYMDGSAVIAVEWSENIESELPDNTIYITLTRLSDNEREIEITGDERFEAAFD